jgi:hypothetical protein
VYLISEKVHLRLDFSFLRNQVLAIFYSLAKQHLCHSIEVKYLDFCHLSVDLPFSSLTNYFEVLKIYSTSVGFPKEVGIFLIGSF